MDLVDHEPNQVAPRGVWRQDQLGGGLVVEHLAPDVADSLDRAGQDLTLSVAELLVDQAACAVDPGPEPVEGVDEHAVELQDVGLFGRDGLHQGALLDRGPLELCQGAPDLRELGAPRRGEDLLDLDVGLAVANQSVLDRGLAREALDLEQPRLAQATGQVSAGLVELALGRVAVAGVDQARLEERPKRAQLRGLLAVAPGRQERQPRQVTVELALDRPRDLRALEHRLERLVQGLASLGQSLEGEAGPRLFADQATVLEHRDLLDDDGLTVLAGRVADHGQGVRRGRLLDGLQDPLGAVGLAGEGKEVELQARSVLDRLAEGLELVGDLVREPGHDHAQGAHDALDAAGVWGLEVLNRLGRGGRELDPRRLAVEDLIHPVQGLAEHGHVGRRLADAPGHVEGTQELVAVQGPDRAQGHLLRSVADDLDLDLVAELIRERPQAAVGQEPGQELELVVLAQALEELTQGRSAVVAAPPVTLLEGRAEQARQPLGVSAQLAAQARGVEGLDLSRQASAGAAEAGVRDLSAGQGREQARGRAEGDRDRPRLGDATLLLGLAGRRRGLEGPHDLKARSLVVVGALEAVEGRARIGATTQGLLVFGEDLDPSATQGLSQLDGGGDLAVLVEAADRLGGRAHQAPGVTALGQTVRGQALELAEQPLAGREPHLLVIEGQER